MKTTHADAGAENRTLRITKILNAPVDRVWEAWTRPAQIALWWGPAGFTNTIHQMDTVPGGEWRLTMCGPDGKTYPNKSEFVEIVPRQKIVFRHFHPNYLATVTFTARAAETLLDWTMEFETAELFETVVNVFKADEGLGQNVEKLEKYLNGQTDSPESVG